MRYEKKYLITHLNKSAIEQAVKLHPAGFSKIFPDRQINNIYFDTPDYQTCLHNLEGVNHRKKYRLRWYGTDLENIKQPRFEIKIKHNELGRKSIQNFPDTKLINLLIINDLVNQMNRQLLLVPSLMNTYQRSYFGTSNGKFRMTVDWNLQFYQALHKGAFCTHPFQDKAAILELKYEEGDDDLANQIFKYIPFRQTKSSKYVTGILKTRAV